LKTLEVGEIMSQVLRTSRRKTLAEQ